MKENRYKGCTITKTKTTTDTSKNCYGKTYNTIGYLHSIKGKINKPAGQTPFIVSIKEAKDYITEMIVMEQGKHVEHALWILSLLKRDFDILTIEGMFNWIVEIQDEIKQCTSEYSEALKILGIVRRDFTSLTSEHVFNQILKVEGLLKANSR